MKKLIISEKPSVSSTVVEALSTLETLTKKDGYYESNNYIVVNLFGHLYQLYDIDDYFNGEKQKWSLEGLPFVPQEFKFKVKNDKGVKDRVKLVNFLMNRNDVSAIIHNGDSDREGELLVRLVITNGLKSEKPIYRLWLPETTEQEILSAIKNLKSDDCYDNIAREGYARTYVDWILGINYTRYLSIKIGKLFRVGRVSTALVKAIYDRELEIKNFTPEKYYQVSYTGTTESGEEFTLTVPQKFSVTERKNACELCDFLNSYPFCVNSVETKERIKQSPRLFSTEDAAGYLASKHKVPLNVTIQALQTLYEKYKCTTYPRTETTYLGESEKDKIKRVIKTLTEQGETVKFKDSKKIFDSTKIESHSAITPTYVIAKGLNETEQLVYNTIRNRFCAVFCDEDCILLNTEVIIKGTSVPEHEKYEFKLKGDVIKQRGWLKYEKSDNIKPLPMFVKGTLINANFSVVEKQTTPPNRYTVSTFGAFCKNPFAKDIKDNNEDEYYKELFSGVEIGTTGTRPGILEKAKLNGYISEKKCTYYIEENGIALINALNKLGINLYKMKTVEVNKMLKQVKSNDVQLSEAISYANKEVTSVICDKGNIEIEKIKNERELIGVCPKCGGLIYEGAKSFYCDNYKKGCDFKLWKANRFLESMGKKEITACQAKQLLLKNKTFLKGLCSKKGNKFDAYLCVNWLPDTKFSLEFKK